VATKEALTVQEVAKILGVCTKTVYRLIKCGKLPAFRIATRGHGDFRIKTVDLLTFAEQNRHRYRRKEAS
jgi:excisionase family DNA binding protein